MADAFRARRRGGYALLAVVWLCLGVGALGATLWATGMRAAGTSRNRVALTRAEWIATGCAARARALIENSIAAGNGSRQQPWSRVDELLRESSVAAGTAHGCDLSARPVGDRLDINRADLHTLGLFFLSRGADPAVADSLASLVASLVSHDPERSTGSSQRGRRITDLHHLAGLIDPAALEWMETVFGAEAGPVSINHAPDIVLRLLPGMLPEVVDRILAARHRGSLVLDFTELAESLPASLRQVVLDSLPALAAESTLLPVGWIVTSRATSGRPPVSVVVEMRIELLERAPVTRRRRSWIQ